MAEVKMTTSDSAHRPRPHGPAPAARLARLGICSLVAAAVFYFFLPPVPLRAQDAELLVAPGKLSRVHAGLAGIQNCTACHTEKKKVDPGKCMACHKDLAARIKAGRGLHKKWAASCLPCHPEHQGEDFKLIEWDLKKFSHGETGFPLTGMHKKIANCSACHGTANALPRKTGKTYLLKDTGCAACHPDPHRGERGTSCAQCHSLDVPFKQAAFDHAQTGFPLRGAHKTVACAQCHPGGTKNARIAFASCGDCHADRHQPSRGKDCRACHDENSWKTARFNHDRTRFPLRGKHQALACAQCHPVGSKIGKIPFASCSDCHRRDPHQGRFGKDCQSCHVVEGFQKASFNHADTRFPLTGKHAAVACRKCHAQKGSGGAAVFKPLPMACASCHADVHLGQFAKGCDACHTTQGFAGAALKFDHQAASAFPLQGKHAAIACAQCHVKTRGAFPAGQGEAVRYKPLAGECLACHGDYHQGQLARDCRQCHGLDSFKPAPGFDHERSRFPLKLFHQGVACRQCHPPAGFTAAGKTVQTARYKNIGGECRECHRDFDHGRTGFALSGAHGGLDCGACHNARTPNIRKKGTGQADMECTGCHKSPHLGRQKNCRECHSGKDWRVEPW